MGFKVHVQHGNISQSGAVSLGKYCGYSIYNAGSCTLQVDNVLNLMPGATFNVAFNEGDWCEQPVNLQFLGSGGLAIYSFILYN